MLTTKMSAISRMPALMIWTASPLAGVVTTTVVSAVSMTSSSDWPTPTVSSRHRSRPEASRRRIASRAAAASPPRCPRAAMLRMKTPGSSVCADHSDAIAQDRPPGERARGIDGDDAHLVSAGSPALDHLVAEGALAAPRGAGHPDHASQAGPFANLTEEIGDARDRDPRPCGSHAPGRACRPPSDVRRAGLRASLEVYRRPEFIPPTVTLTSAEFVIKPQVRRQRASLRRPITSGAAGSCSDS